MRNLIDSRHLIFFITLIILNCSSSIFASDARQSEEPIPWHQKYPNRYIGTKAIMQQLGRNKYSAPRTQPNAGAQNRNIQPQDGANSKVNPDKNSDRWTLWKTSSQLLDISWKTTMGLTGFYFATSANDKINKIPVPEKGTRWDNPQFRSDFYACAFGISLIAIPVITTVSQGLWNIFRTKNKARSS